MHLLLLSLGFQTSPPPPRPAPPATPAPRVLPALHDPPDLSALPAPPAHAALPGPPALPSPSRSSFFALSSLPASPPCFRWAFLAWRATLHHSLACWTYSGYRRRWNKRRMRCLFHTLLSVDPFSEGGGAQDHSLPRWKHTMGRRQNAKVHGEVPACSAHCFRWAFLGRGNTVPLLASLVSHQEQTPKEQPCMTRWQLFPHAAFGRPVFKGAVLVHPLPRCELAWGRHRGCENALRVVN